MSDAFDEVDTSGEMGPIDYLVVEFPGNRMTGEGFPLLVDLVDRGLIRILDLTFIRKEADGSVTGLEIADLTGDGELDLAVFEGASSGLLGQDDLKEAAAALEPGNSAGVLDLREPLGRAVRRRPATRRCRAGRLRKNPRAGGPGRARRDRNRTLRARGSEKGDRHARTPPRGGPYGRRRRNRDRRVEPCIPPTAGAMGGPAGDPGARTTAAAPGRAASAPPATDMTSKIEQLKQLGDLKAQGVLTEAEFEEQKRELLGS